MNPNNFIIISLNLRLLLLVKLVQEVEFFQFFPNSFYIFLFHHKSLLQTYFLYLHQLVVKLRIEFQCTTFSNIMSFFYKEFQKWLCFFKIYFVFSCIFVWLIIFQTVCVVMCSNSCNVLTAWREILRELLFCYIFLKCIYLIHLMFHLYQTYIEY